MLHWLLSAAHRELESSFGDTPATGPQAAEAFDQIVERLVAELRGRPAGGLLSAGMWEIDVRKVVAWIERYRGQHRSYAGHWSDFGQPPQPAALRGRLRASPPRRLGRRRGELPDDCDPLSTLEPFELDCGGETIRFAGRIDRIDLGTIAGQVVFTIVDYKSGKASPRTSLQSVHAGPLVAVAALCAGGRAVARAARGRAVSRRLLAPGRPGLSGEGGRQVSPQSKAAGSPSAKSWRTLEQTNSQAASLRSSAAFAMASFPMHSADEECTGRCDFSTVCRVNHARAVGKQWQPPREIAP